MGLMQMRSIAVLLALVECNPAKHQEAVADSATSQAAAWHFPGAPLDASAEPGAGSTSDASAPAATSGLAPDIEAARARCPPSKFATEASIPVIDVTTPTSDRTLDAGAGVVTVIPFSGYSGRLPKLQLVEGDEVVHWPPELASLTLLVIGKCTIVKGSINDCHFIKTHPNERIARLVREAVVANLACRRYARYRVDGEFLDSIQWTFTFRIGAQ